MSKPGFGRMVFGACCFIAGWALTFIVITLIVGIPLTFFGAYLLVDGGMKMAALSEKFARVGIPTAATKILRLGLILILAGCAFILCPLAYLTFVLGIPVLGLGLLVSILAAAFCVTPLLDRWREQRRRQAAMNQLTCCTKPAWIAELDLADAAGFDYLLGKCQRCGAYWMNVFCVATSRTGFEPVSLADVERMKSIAGGPELKEFMRSWGEKNI